MEEQNKNQANEMLYNTMELYWLMDEDDETNLRPFLYLSKERKMVGFLDDLSKGQLTSKNQLVVRNDVFLRHLYRISSSTNARNEIDRFDYLDFEVGTLSRDQILELKELCSKISKKCLSDHKKQSELFSYEDIEQRRRILKMASINNKDIKWEIQADDASVIRPLLLLEDNRVGYLDNCEIGKLPSKENLVSCTFINEMILSYSKYSTKYQDQIDMVIRELTRFCRLSQKRLALISEIYNTYSNDFVDDKMKIESIFENN